MDTGGLRDSFLGCDIREHAGAAGGFFGAGDTGDTIWASVARVVDGRREGKAGEPCVAGRGVVCGDGAYGGGALPISGELRDLLH